MDLEARIDRLEDALTRLAEAQARTEERVGHLEGALIRLTERVDRLAEAQVRTEARLEQLAQAQQQLAQAQVRTEARLEQLAQAQQRTEARLEQLAQAQQRTEEATRSLAQAVGRLSDTVGYGLEDIARVILPGYLERHFGIRVGELERRFVGPEGNEVEINLYGEGEQNGRRIILLGEAKSRVYARDVEQFDRTIQPAVETLSEQPIKVMVGYLIHPSASRAAAERGILLVASYQR